VSTNTPYKRVDSYIADLKYDPDPQVPLHKRRVGDEFKLDNDPYKIVEITNNAVRVQSERIYQSDRNQVDAVSKRRLNKKIRRHDISCQN
jgi:hypothetical protein